MESRMYPLVCIIQQLIWAEDRCEILKNRYHQTRIGKNLDVPEVIQVLDEWQEFFQIKRHLEKEYEVYKLQA